MSDQKRKFAAARTATVLLMGTLALNYALSIFAFPGIENAFIARSQDDSKSMLRLVSDAVDQAIGRYEPVPGLIAGDPLLRALLTDTENEGLVPYVNEKLRQTARAVNASEIYVLDADGTTIASSNYRETDSFMGKNFAYRPYFQKAVQGEAAKFHALGTTSGERGFFFAIPILEGIQVRGVVTVKVTVDSIETSWEGAPVEIIVADENGVAFLSSFPDYRLRVLEPLSGDVQSRIAETRQFPLDVLTRIPFSKSITANEPVETELLYDGDLIRYLSDAQSLTLAGWRAIALTPLGPIRAEAIKSVVLWNLAVTAICLTALIFLQSRVRVLERIRVAQTQKVLLEKRVKARTAELDDANSSLREEVQVRRDTEQRLRKTQKDLVQAGKLAALGQMSAALSHEINQPLAAVKSYAENARAYITRNRVEDADSNIARISEMADRMAKISGHLRNFARQPTDTLKPVLVHDAILEAIAILDPKLGQAKTKVTVESSDKQIWALCGRLRLQQVIVNILTNAIDAMDGKGENTITIHTEQTDKGVFIYIRDHGPGLAPSQIDQVFDAFFTTKDAGSGMGLGLSISHNIIEDFGGKLSGTNHPDGGAYFTVQLVPSEPGEQIETSKVGAR